ncbi:MAG TPA: hypothetical protein VIM12_14135 [Noviherbaspirillum sp.]|jgi:hypothetical protein|uniref:hypothetical protein n=1 Tax=Noviherbaspirillum sp. TaxID=1926288 RepID=UPI002F948C15
MPAGANPKREREYGKLARRFHTEHRYPGREEEVAARIVNKQRSSYGESSAEKRKEKQGKSPDRGLPVAGYQKLTIAQAAGKLDGLSAAQIRKVRNHESRHKNRKGMIALLDRLLARH